MKRFTLALSILVLCLAALIMSPATQADEWNKKTFLTFNKPVELPGGVILPAGTYVFILMDSFSDRHIVRVFNKDHNHLIASILAIPNYRLQTTDKTVITFGERAVGAPEAIRAWFYPGANWGEEFVYPKTRAYELAKVNNQPVLAMPVELEPVITTEPTGDEDKPVVALKSAPLKAVKPTGEEVEVAEVVQPAPAQPVNDQSSATLAIRKPTKRLPQTASQLPLLAILGLLSLGAGFGLLAASKRTEIC